jgi:hypothetical protein
MLGTPRPTQPAQSDADWSFFYFYVNINSLRNKHV